MNESGGPELKVVSLASKKPAARSLAELKEFIDELQKDEETCDGLLVIRLDRTTAKWALAWNCFGSVLFYEAVSALEIVKREILDQMFVPEE
jgi:hypothetical protein